MFSSLDKGGTVRLNQYYQLPAAIKETSRLASQYFLGGAARHWLDYNYYEITFHDRMLHINPHSMCSRGAPLLG